MPPQNPFNPGPAIQGGTPAGPPDFAALRKALEAKMGTDPGTPMDVGLRVPEEIMNNNPFSGMMDWMNKDPHAAPPGAPPPMGPAVAPPPAPTPPPALGPNQFSLPMGSDPTKSSVGSMSYNGPKLGNEAALAGLKTANAEPVPQKSSAFQPGFGGSAYDQGNSLQPSEADMLHMSMRDPGTTAPGSNQFWGSQLTDLNDQEAFQKTQEHKQADLTGTAQTMQNPAIQSGLQQQAERAPAVMAAEKSAAPIAPYYAALAKTLGGGTGADLKSVSKSGVTFQTDKVLPPALYAQLTRDRANLAASKGTFGQSSPQAEAAFKSTQANVINAFPANPDVRDLMHVILNDPAASRAPDAAAALQIMTQHGLDPSALTPEEQQQISAMFELVKP